MVIGLAICAAQKFAAVVKPWCAWVPASTPPRLFSTIDAALAGAAPVASPAANNTALVEIPRILVVLGSRCPSRRGNLTPPPPVLRQNGRASCRDRVGQYG